ncbi:MFS transporter [Variovorax sp. PAMC26660]|uniref:MFS transporter n=1 Tax=Variovorax sp. PAMC26660 TaxID=2762322 RepID=UPI00164D49AB|nr:MFS transporter [Variovorax sp. PAMC26660]QNK68614.1 MFS transporter [Variovorax sp. PAMC26660]
MSNPVSIAGEPAVQASSAVPVAARERASASAWYGLAVLIVAALLGAIDLMIFNLLAEPVRITLGLSDTQLGLLRGVGLTLFTTLATLPLAWLSDRYDRRYVLAACVVLWSAATAMRGLAPNYTMLFIASIGLGVGEAGVNPIVNSLIPELFPRAQRVLANAVYALSLLFGSALGSILGGVIVTVVDGVRHLLPVSLQGMETWRLVFFVMSTGAVPVVLLLLTTRWPRRARDPRPVAQEAHTIGYGDYLRTNWRTLGGIVVGLGLASIGLIALDTWIPIIMVRQFGVAPADMGRGIGLAALAGILGGAVLGVGSMRFAQRVVGPAAALRMIALGLVTAASLSVLLLFVRSPMDVYVLQALVLVPLIGGSILSPNVLQDISPPHLRARVLAALALAMLPFAVLSPLAIGMLSDAVKASSPNGLALAVVAVTLVTSGVGALMLRATEGSFVRLVRTLQPAA